MRVLISIRAERSIDSIAQYISGQGYPETAFLFISRLKDFIHQIADFPEKYPVCRQKSHRKRNSICAVFEKHYTVVFKVYTYSVL